MNGKNGANGQHAKSVDRPEGAQAHDDRVEDAGAPAASKVAPDGLESVCKALRKAGKSESATRILEIAARHRIEPDDPAFGMFEVVLADLEIRAEYLAFVEVCRDTAACSAIEASRVAKAKLNTELVRHVAVASEELQRLAMVLAAEIEQAARRIGRKGAAVVEAEIGRHVRVTRRGMAWWNFASVLLVIATAVSGVAYGQWIGVGEAGRRIAAARSAEQQLAATGWLVRDGDRQVLFVPTSGDARRCQAARPGDGETVRGACIAVGPG